ncbi:MAG: hypothetical protein IKW02_04500 [Clostridia bacterium]|nr:hypothetical protein [Clostridia bacterium]
MEKLTVDFGKVKGKIKAMNAVGQPPLQGANTKAFSYLKDANIPFSRLHDVGGMFGQNLWVDIPNIFRDFDADETKEENYDFAFTDILIKGLIENNCYPIFRLGVTIENYFYIKAYRIFPPKDFAKWARICEHIIRHYNEGWADGFHYDIKYWEIWNEADNGPNLQTNSMWHGTKEQFYEFYAVAAKHLKSVFGDNIKVGGYGSSGVGFALTDPEKYGLDIEPMPTDIYMSERGQYMLDFFDEFMDYIKKEGAPMDFFSWHAYGLSPEQTVACTLYIDKKLAECGCSYAENQLNEWSVAPTSKLQGTVKAAAKCVATMCLMQDTSTNILCLYDARMSSSMYAAVFNSLTKKPYPLYFALKAFGELYALGNQVESEITGEELYVQAAEKDGKKAVLISNASDVAKEIETNLDADMKAYIIDEGLELEPDGTKSDKFIIPGSRTILFKNY